MDSATRRMAACETASTSTTMRSFKRRLCNNNSGDSQTVCGLAVNNSILHTRAHTTDTKGPSTPTTSWTSSEPPSRQPRPTSKDSTQQNGSSTRLGPNRPITTNDKIMTLLTTHHRTNSIGPITQPHGPPPLTRTKFCRKSARKIRPSPQEKKPAAPRNQRS